MFKTQKFNYFYFNILRSLKNLTKKYTKELVLSDKEYILNIIRGKDVIKFLHNKISSKVDFYHKFTLITPGVQFLNRDVEWASRKVHKAPKNASYYPPRIEIDF